MLPHISIIIPVYNVARYLPECLESARAQEVEGLEIIAINDASTDNSGEILETYAQKDARIRAIHLAENIGQGLARNKALELARGEWIAFLDSDDVMVPGALPVLVEIAEKEQADLVIGGFTARIDEADGSFQLCKENIFEKDDVGNVDIQNCPRLLRIFSSVQAIYRRAFLEEHGLRFLRPYYEDTDFIMKALLEAEKIILRGDIDIMHYRKRYTLPDEEQSTTERQQNKHNLDMLLCALEAEIRLLEEEKHVLKFGKTSMKAIKKHRLSILIFAFFGMLPKFRHCLDGKDTAFYERMAALGEASELRKTGWERMAMRNIPSTGLRAKVRLTATQSFYSLVLWMMCRKWWRGVLALMTLREIVARLQGRLARVFRPFALLNLQRASR